MKIHLLFVLVLLISSGCSLLAENVNDNLTYRMIEPNKGGDSFRSDASQLINAVDRYRVINERMPWGSGDTSYFFEKSPELFDHYHNQAGWLYELEIQDEIKPALVNRLEEFEDLSVFYNPDLSLPEFQRLQICSKPKPYEGDKKLQAKERCQDEDWLEVVNRYVGTICRADQEYWCFPGLDQ